MKYPEYWETIFEVHNKVVKKHNGKVRHDRSQATIKKIRGK